MIREGEERRLLAVSEPLLQRRIIGAIETCCRRGELGALQWRDVNLSTRELLVRAEEEGARKTGVGRRLPISARLAAVLEMAQTAMETMLRSGPAKGLSDREVTAALGACYVFGDEAGLKVDSFKRSWETAVLKAHGHTPQWTKTTKALTRDSRAALEAIDLHFHDLRHEGGSRLLEAGWPLAPRPAHARAHEPRTDLDLPERDADRVARKHAAIRGNSPRLQSRCKQEAPPTPRSIATRIGRFRATSCELRS